MGVCLTPHFNKKLPGAEFDSDGKNFTLFFDLLNDISEEQGLTRFSDFTDDAVLEALEESRTYKEPWSSPSEGLRTIRGLIKVLESEPGRVKKPLRRRAKGLVEDLRDLERCLEIAKKKRARFFLMFW